MAHRVFSAEEAIDMLRPLKRFLRFVQRKLKIISATFAADDKMRVWRVQGEQRPDVSDAPDAGRALVPVPIRVRANPIVKGGNGTDGHSEFHAWVQRSDPVGAIRAARFSGKPDSLRVDLGTRRQDVHRADCIERFKCGGGAAGEREGANAMAIRAAGIVRMVAGYAV